jgi:hypothetical protein
MTSNYASSNCNASRKGITVKALTDEVFGNATKEKA